MRKVIAGFASSLDGYIEGAKGEIDWILIDKEIDFAEEAKKFDTYLYGRISYEKTIAMGMPSSSDIKHYVFSKTLKEVAEGYTLISNNFKREILSIKQRSGKDIAVFGGANLLTSLLNEDLVDEIWISMIPVILGSGKPMVDVLSKNIWLTFMGSKTYKNGTVKLNYSVNKNNTNTT